MRDEETRLLFQALSQILANQDDIKKHLGLNRLDSEYGWNDEDTMKLSRKCSKQRMILNIMILVTIGKQFQISGFFGYKERI